MMNDRLDQVEAIRQARQGLVDSRTSAPDRNRLGQFATPTPLALDMAALAACYHPAHIPVRFLDPAVGTGVFYYAARKVFDPARFAAAVGFEIDPAVAADAEGIWGGHGLTVRRADFSTAPVPAGLFSVVLCNPPYVRHHHLSADRKARLRKETVRVGIRLSGLTGLYGYFLVLAHRWMKPGGVGVWIMPAEFMDVNYGDELKSYLARRVTLHQVHRFDPSDAQFVDALVSSVVVAFTNEPPPAGHRVRLTTGPGLLDPTFTREVPAAALEPTAKWGPLYSLSNPVSPLRTSDVRIGDLFSVRRGLATGANGYFILPRGRSEELGLPAEFLRPILPSPRHIPGDDIGRGPDGFPKDLLQLVLLDCDRPMAEIRSRYPRLARYLQDGIASGIAGRYIPAHRSPWYRQERRPAAHILCTYMGRQTGGRAIRFLRNRSAATAPNVYLMLYPKGPFASACAEDPGLVDFVYAALVEAAGTSVPRGGRVYGGGLNKIEPKEMEAVPLPGWIRDRLGAVRDESNIGLFDALQATAGDPS